MKYLSHGMIRWLAILLPPISVLTFCLVMMPRLNKLEQVRQELRTTRNNINDLAVKIRAISNLPLDPKVASMPSTKQEQTDFLRGLTNLCYRTGNSIINVSSLSAPVQVPAAAVNTPAAAPDPALPGALPPDVIEIKSSILFEGSFTTVRGFLAGLQNSRRLISLSDCRVGPGTDGYPSLQMNLTISRYVDKVPVTLSAPAPASIAGQSSAPQTTMMQSEANPERPRS